MIDNPSSKANIEAADGKKMHVMSKENETS